MTGKEERARERLVMTCNNEGKLQVKYRLFSK